LAPFLLALLFLFRKTLLKSLPAASSPPSSASARELDPGVIRPGTRVTLRGLRSQAARNGEAGSVSSYDAGKMRYSVALSSGETLSLSPLNLRQQPAVTLRNLESAGALNGSAGSVVSFDEEKGRYNVHLPAQRRTIALRPGNVLLARGTVARTAGLVREGHNGRWGTVGRYDDAAGRVELRMSAQSTIKVKLENLIV
jgi:hypothetical protein